MEIFCLWQKGTGAESNAMVTSNGCHFVSYLMYITGAKFEFSITPIFPKIDFDVILSLH